jgi:hypothetical protein
MWLEARQEFPSPALLLYVVLTCASPPVAVAQTATDASVTTSSNEDLAKLKQNPISVLRQLIFNAEVSPNLPGTGEIGGGPCPSRPSSPGGNECSDR